MLCERRHRSMHISRKTRDSRFFALRFTIYITRIINENCFSNKISLEVIKLACIFDLVFLRRRKKYEGIKLTGNGTLMKKNTRLSSGMMSRILIEHCEGEIVTF